MKISVIIIARNEERKLKSCLEHLKFADEILLIDNGSSDKTVKIAQNFGCRVFSSAGTDFARARELGAKNAKSDWLLYIDADEIVDQKLASEISKSLKLGYDAFEIIRINYFYGKLFPVADTLIRLIKKDCLKGWQGKIHESPLILGGIGRLSSPLLHYTHDDISRMVEKTNLWSEIEAENRFRNGHPPVVSWRLFRVALSGFLNSFIKDKSYKMGIFGVIESLYQSFSMFITYAKLWEKQNRTKKS